MSARLQFRGHQGLGQRLGPENQVGRLGLPPGGQGLGNILPKKLGHMCALACLGIWEVGPNKFVIWGRDVSNLLKIPNEQNSSREFLAPEKTTVRFRYKYCFARAVYNCTKYCVLQVLVCAVSYALSTQVPSVGVPSRNMNLAKCALVGDGTISATQVP